MTNKTRRRWAKSLLFFSLFFVFGFSTLAQIISPSLGTPKASAASSYNYVFSTGFSPNDQEKLKTFKDAVKKNDHENSIFSNTYVGVKGGPFGNKAIKLNYDQTKTGCAQAGGFSFKNCYGAYGGADKTLYVYSTEYMCRNNKIIDSVPKNAYYIIRYSVSLNLGGSNGAFNGDTLKNNTRLHWVGFGSAKTPGVTVFGDTKPNTVRAKKDLNIDRIPKGCLPPDVPSSVSGLSEKDSQDKDEGIINKFIPILERASDSIKKSWQKAGLSPSTSTGSGSSSESGSGSGEVDAACTYSPNPLTWVVCPVIDGFEQFVNGLDNMITSLLSVGSPGNSDNPSNIFCNKGSQDLDQCDAYHTAWASFRNIALGLLLVVGLVVIISEMANIEIFSAYALKKMIPRLVAVAILMTLSWQLMEFFVQLSNALGYGVRYLIYQPFLAAGFDQMRIGGGGAATAVVLTIFMSGALGVFGVLSFALTAAIGVLIAFLVLMIREMVIIALVIIAPIAIVLYVLPNTERWFKMWWETFSKALLMFPMIAAMIAAGHVFGAVVTEDSQNNPFNQILGFAAYFGPYFMIPMTFKFSGAAMAAIGGAMNDNGLVNGIRGSIGKYRGRQLQEHGGRRVEGLNRRIMSRRADLNSRLQRAASNDNRSDFSRWALGRTAGALGGYNLEARQSAKRAEAAKEVNDQIATGVDSEVRGLLINKERALNNGHEGEDWRVNENGTRQFRSLAGAWVDEANVDAAQRRWGHDDFAKQAALSYEMRKIDTSEDATRLRRHFGATALAGGMSAETAAGVWMGAAFENQDKHTEFKYRDWQTGGMSASQAEGFASEVAEKKSAYQIGQLHGSSIESLQEAYDIAGADSNTDRGTRTQSNVTQIAENFTTRSAGSGGTVIGGEGAELEGPAIAAARRAGGVDLSSPGYVSASVGGAAHTSEAARRLAVHVGVYRSDIPRGDQSRGPLPPVRPTS